MNKEQIRHTVLSICDENRSEDVETTLSSHLHNDLGFDSLDKITTVMEVETAFNVVIQDEEIDGLKTVSDIADLVEKKLKS